MKKNSCLWSENKKEYQDKIQSKKESLEHFGKPKSEEDAFNTLKLLSNKTHEVITGFAIISKDFKYVSHEITKVTFNNLTDKLILDYIKTGSPLDKAGSYGIQDGYNLVKEIVGDYENVVGLPTNKILRESIFKAPSIYCSKESQQGSVINEKTCVIKANRAPGLQSSPMSLGNTIVFSPQGIQVIINTIGASQSNRAPRQM